MGAEDETIKTMWGNGQTFGQIGKALNMTRSAVAGRIHRMREKGLIGAYVVPYKVAKMPVQAPIPVVEKPAPAPKPEVIAKPPKNGVALLNLKENGCRYAIYSRGTRHLFCGEPKLNGFSYCEEHNKLVWIKPRAAIKTWDQRR